jgi:hypothetical protein
MQSAWTGWASLHREYLSKASGPSALPTLLSTALDSFKEDVDAVSRHCRAVSTRVL